MSAPSRYKNIHSFARYAWITFTQGLTNPEYFLFWFNSTVLAIAYFETINYGAWIAIGVFNLFVGILAVGSVVRIVDQAMISLGLGFEKTGYGMPTWIVQGARPFAQKVIRIRAAGFAASDFEKHLDQISSRLSMPIETVRKPSFATPVIEFVVRHSTLPNTLKYLNLDLDSLKPGEFYIGQDQRERIKALLSKLPHLIAAGQTGSGKTTFLLQLLATILTRTKWAHACLIDFKGGVDFHAFSECPNFELFTNLDDAIACMDAIERLYDQRSEYLRKKKLSNWTLVSMKDLASDPEFTGKPIGPLLLVFDELAELSRRAKSAQQGDELQDRLASFTQKCRYAGIHLIFGVQRPDKRILDGQSTDNVPARVCFSMPSVAASNIVLQNMMASTLGAHPGRAVFKLAENRIVQTPYISSTKLTEIMIQTREKLNRSRYDRQVIQKAATPRTPGEGGFLK